MMTTRKTHDFLVLMYPFPDPCNISLPESKNNNASSIFFPKLLKSFFVFLKLKRVMVDLILVYLKLRIRIK